MATDDNRKPATWVVVKTFNRGSVAVEVSRAGDTDHYSYRPSWAPASGQQGAWFPAHEMPFADDLHWVCVQAEAWIAERKGEALREQEERIASKRARLSTVADRANAILGQPAKRR